MICEDQMILLQMYKVEVAAYSQAVRALRASNGGTANEFLTQCAVAKELLQSSLALLGCLRDHIDQHGCRVAPDSFMMEI